MPLLFIEEDKACVITSQIKVKCINVKSISNSCKGKNKENTPRPEGTPGRHHATIIYWRQILRRYVSPLNAPTSYFLGLAGWTRPVIGNPAINCNCVSCRRRVSCAHLDDSSLPGSGGGGGNVGQSSVSINSNQQDEHSVAAFLDEEMGYKVLAHRYFFPTQPPHNLASDTWRLTDIPVVGKLLRGQMLALYIVPSHDSEKRDLTSMGHTQDCLKSPFLMRVTLSRAFT